MPQQICRLAGISVYPRFTQDLVLGDFQYPNEPNGRILVMGSPWMMQWLGERDRQDLQTITRWPVIHHHHQNNS